MNEDIKILREALAKHDPKKDRPLDFSILCTPDRIRRLLDDAERWAAFMDSASRQSTSFVILWNGERMSPETLKNYCDEWREPA